MSKPFIFRAWLIRQLRRASYRFPPFYKVENAAKREFFIDGKTPGKKLRRVEYQCNQCKNWFNKKEINKDHIIPVIDPVRGFPLQENGDDDWTEYIKRMFMNNVQMLCIACHNIKSGDENKIRRNRKKPKDK